MTTLLTDNLPLLAGAPNGIKKLRELILELAVRGKLVPQDPSDEPAIELLKRISEEKSRLVAEGKIKKQKALAEITEEEKPFDLPIGWEWARFGSILDFQGGGQPPKDYFSETPQLGYVQLIQIRDLGERPQPVFIPRELASKFCTSNDIMVGRYGASVGKTFWGKEGSYNVALVKMVDEHNIFYKGFLYQLLKSPLGQAYFLGISRSAQNGFNKSDIEQNLVPISPRAEQHRIVAKVDELMVLCDRLEAQQAGAESAHTQLVQALLDSLTQANDTNDFTINWQRLAEHFETLFTTEPSIDALKQTLMQLAVMGKLVAQDPSDEPASELLKRIAEEKGQLVNKGKIRKQKPLAEITEEEKPYELPAAWAWTRLGSQVLESGAGWSPSCEARPRDGAEWGVLKVSAVSWGIYRPEENKALPPNLEARPEYEVAKGDFLVSRANTAELVARSVVAEETPKHLMLSDKIVRLKLTSMCARRYMNLANSAPLARRYYSQVAGGTSSSMKNVSREQILNLPIALPPLAEQRRIVAKFDSLVAICDTLKRQINAATEKQIALLNAFMAKI